MFMTRTSLGHNDGMVARYRDPLQFISPSLMPHHPDRTTISSAIGLALGPTRSTSSILEGNSSFLEQANHSRIGPCPGRRVSNSFWFMIGSGNMLFTFSRIHLQCALNLSWERCNGLAQDQSHNENGAYLK